MAEQENVKISAWPANPARLTHEFGEAPCPVRIHFEASPARVRLETTTQQPIQLAMGTSLSAKSPLPICIRVCEPICAESDYRVGMTVFDQAVAQVTVRGRTRLGQCDEGKSTVCVNFSSLTPNTPVTNGVELRGLKFKPVAGELRVTSAGQPPGEMKLAFDSQGVAIEFPAPANGVVLRLNCHSGAGLRLIIHVASGVSTAHDIAIVNEAKTVPVSEQQVVRVEVVGGNNEASLSEVCFEPQRAPKTP